MHDCSVAIRWVFTDLTAADGHALTCAFSCRVRALAQPAEKQMLAETLLADGQQVRPADVQRHLSETLRSAAARRVQTQPVEQWLTDAAQAELCDELTRVAQAVAFTSGLEVLAPFELSSDSPTLAQQRIEAQQRQEIEARAERRRQMAQRIAEAIAGGKELTIDADDADQRRDYVSALIDAAAARAAAARLCAVSGNSLLIADPASPAAVQSIALPVHLGPLRSIRAIQQDGRPMLLIGAQTGLLVVDPAAPDATRSYADGQLKSTLGFNQCLRLGEQLWACHGDGGIVTWDLASQDQPVRMTRPDALRSALGAPANASPRHLCAIGEGRLLFAMGPILATIDREHAITRLESSDPADVIAILTYGTAGRVNAGVVHIVRKNGTTGVRTLPDLRIDRLLDRTSPPTAAVPLPCFGLPLRLVANDRGVECLDDTGLRIREFTTTHRDLRQLAASPRWIAALSADRQRAILWQTTTPGRAQHEWHLTARTRHRVADLCWLEQ